MAVTALTSNLFLSFIVQPCHQDANPAGVCWNVQLCLVFHFILQEPVCCLSLRELGQSWEPALTGSSFQLIWLANLISTWSPVAQSQFPLDFPLHGSPVLLHPTNVDCECSQRSAIALLLPATVVAIELVAGKDLVWEH